ncbi:hypothetical protein FSZ31_11535 [Sphingorhabdus soli]|uniref:Uncharacterized protein n=1 Tax=Flavisphingopyxis soli TaxID=2601267 RepID=A0A5C6U5V2_9SPHN|nr:hypothetical protein [Sphingorhabdus soli]TXC68303.1 hypothetical protein FSZ31_11535 [Sphingorhabdus soli]
METRAKVFLGSVTTGLVIMLAVSLVLALIDVPKIGRSDPKQAAKYRPPLFNFFETYVSGSVLGVAVGSTKADAIQAAELAGLTVEPSGWGDNRAGGASLYERPNLLATMLRQTHLNFHDEADLLGGMTIHFSDGRVERIEVHYINTELI